MRPKPALAILALLASVAGIWTSLPRNAQSQDAAGANTRGEVSRAASSLDLGNPFDWQTQWRFEQQLTEQERARLISLQARFELAQADCPLPVATPRQPFYVKFRAPLTREFADRLSAAGASFVGYAYPHAHFIRAANADSLQQIGLLLRGSPLVAGTVLRLSVDALDPLAWRVLQDEEFVEGAFRLRFWADIAPAKAEELLAARNITITEATRDENGRLDLETPFVDTWLTHAQLAELSAHESVEWIAPTPVLVAHNVDSEALSHATPAEIGPATSYNLDGTGMVAGVWDAARARDTHVDFQNATSPSPINNGAKRVLKVDGTSLNYHSTHVTGTIIGDGTGNAGARGYAPKACVVSYSWNSMDSERRTARHDYRHVADNHSYGTGTPTSYDPNYYGGYDTEAQTSDTDIRDILLNMCKSAGNDGSFGSMSCTHDSCMKNSFTIASTSDGGTVSSFSSRGPTLDGRLIPHFAANGENLTSPYDTSNTAYGTISGTSMASPSACGSLVLLAQLFQREYNKQQFSPDLARAIVAATAIERGNQGPDYRYGFGIIDCKRAADLILANKAGGGNHVVRGTMRQGNVLEYNLQVTSSATPLKVVCSWLDIYASTSAGTKLINDIDLELVEPNGSSVRYPWSGLSSSAAGDQTYQWTRTGPNRRDNIELVEVDAPAVGTWKIRVTGFNIPANPQATVRNDATGFVLASENAITASQERFVDTTVAASPVAIPDNDTNGVTRTFNVTNTNPVKNVRVIVDVRHTQRGDIDIYLTHGATTAQIEKKDASTRDDLIAVYPDTRQYDDDTAAFIGQAANGTWTVKVTDTTASNTGTLDWLAIEIDYGVNQPPVANAGPNQSVNEGATVNLTAAASSDPDSDPLSYAWTQTGGTSVSLAGAATATPSFTAPQVTTATVLTFRVTVDDGRGGSDFDDVQVTVNDVNNPPTASAGANQSVNEGASVNLSAAGSTDPDGDTLTYSWAQTSGPAVTLSGAATVAASFAAPQVSAATILVFRVTVNDGKGGSAFADVQVTVNDVPAPNNPPVANAGVNFSVTEGLVANLSGAASTDPDGDPLSYAWAQIGGSAVTLTGAATVAASFTAPMVTAPTPLTFRLTVNDGRGGISTANVVVTVLDSAVNNPPTANAGPDQAVSQSAAVNLNGAGSNDPEGDTLTFSWVQLSGANTVALNNAGTATPDFMAPAADDVLVFRLTVDDGHGNVDTDDVAITVGTAPVGSSGGGGKKGGKGGCSTSEDTSWLWLLLVLAPLAMLRRARGSEAATAAEPRAWTKRPS